MQHLIKMKKDFAQNKKGFTIMETLIAISLLLLAITGPMVFAQNALRAAFNSRDQVTAFYLAQDAIELVKNVRDNNILYQNEDWLLGLRGCSTSDGGCTVDTFVSLGEFESCSNIDKPGCLGESGDASDDVHLKINQNGIIGHTGNTESIFSRAIYIDTDGVWSREAKITVKVRWKSNENIGARDITVVEYIYDWAGTIL